MPATRQVSVRAFAKINLSLAVFNPRPDGYHELRTIFQTITLADRIGIQFAPARRSAIHLESSIDIPGNLMVRAAQMVVDELRLKGEVRLTLSKRIPMGGGLGGGSTDAAAVLMGLPRLAGRQINFSRLHEMAVSLGSDVPFFLFGGAAVGLGRGEELYPLPQVAAGPALIAVPPVHVSTPEAYKSLQRGRPGALTSQESFNKMKRFQSLAHSVSVSVPASGWNAFCENDFEAVVFERYPLLKSLQRAFRRNGAVVARMSGSGSALFGVFDSLLARDQASRILKKAHPGVRFEPAGFVGRKSYQAAWERSFGQ